MTATIKTPPANANYRDNFDRVFRGKKPSRKASEVAGAFVALDKQIDRLEQEAGGAVPLLSAVSSLRAALLELWDVMTDEEQSIVDQR